MVVAVFGWSTASHHRVRQKEKFAFIEMYGRKVGAIRPERKYYKRGRYEKRSGRENIYRIFYRGGANMLWIDWVGPFNK